MPGTQLTCPHCGSTLTFGAAIAAGASVPCLICNRTFQAGGAAGPTSPDTVEAPSPTIADPPSLPRAVSPVQSGPPPVAIAPAAVARAAVPVAVGVAPPPKWAAAPAAPRPVAVPADAPGHSSAAVPIVVGGIVAAALAVVVVGGLAILAWRALATSTPLPSEPGSPLAVQGDDANPAQAAAPAGSPQGALPGGELDVADDNQPNKATPFTDPPTKSKSGAPPPSVVPVTIAAPDVPGVNQKRIDAAIEKGVQYLKNTQNPNGTWPGPRPIGYTALAGLTLLECKVKTNDAYVQKAANYIRNNVGQLEDTYELALAILFLDRIGSPTDRARIQGMALRLTAGQNEAGGWTYKCHKLSPPDMQQLLTFLKSHRPEGAAPLRGVNVAGGEPGKPMTPSGDTLPKQVTGNPDDPFKQLADLLELPRGLSNSKDEPGSRPTGDKADPKQPPINKPGEAPPSDKPAPSDPAKPMGKGDSPVKGASPEKGKKPAPVNPNMLPPPLRALPVVGVNASKGKQKAKHGGGDNSNTQFALLGLWAARRHDVPTEYSLLLGKQRFDISQNKEGGWGYLMGQPSTKTMTCVGLIGLAMGHGALAGDGKATSQDPAIQDGLRALSKHIGTPSKDPNAKPPMENMYFLWSLERVAMLYDLKTIGGKDWYGWGAQILLPNQHADGHWLGSNYPGHTPHLDTCFALLFLKRSNLVPDLTENLRLRMVIRDPEAK